MTLLDWLRFLTHISSLVILAVAAGLAFRKLKRWSLACLLISLLLKVFSELLEFSPILRSDAGMLLYSGLHKLVWLVAIAGGVGEVLRLTGPFGKSTIDAKPVGDGQTNSPSITE